MVAHFLGFHLAAWQKQHINHIDYLVAWKVFKLESMLPFLEYQDGPMPDMTSENPWACGSTAFS